MTAGQRQQLVIPIPIMTIPTTQLYGFTGRRVATINTTKKTMPTKAYMIPIIIVSSDEYSLVSGRI